MNNKSNEFEKRGISNAIVKQVLAAIVLLTIIISGTVISVAADIVVSSNNDGDSSSEYNNNSMDNTDDSTINNEEQTSTADDMTDFVIESINDLTEDNYQLTRRDNLNDYGKIIYDGLYKAVVNHSEFKFTDNIAYSDERSSVLSDVFSTMLSGFVLLDHPEIFWCHGSIKMQTVYSDNKADYSVSMIYDCDENSLDQYENEIKNKLDEIIKNVPKGSKYDQALWVHDYIVNNTDYNKNPMWATGKNKDFGGSIYGLLIKHESVCNGYAKTFKYLMDILNIPCTVITGVCNDGELHAWNIIELDGEYYQIDVTWDDPIGNELILRHDYFCVTDNKIYESRHADDFTSAPRCNSEKLTLL